MSVLRFLAFIVTIVGLTILILSCNTTKKITSGQSELTKLHEMMIGEFSSAEQALADSAFYNINLVMYPIWQQKGDYRWLYVEQAAADYLDKPYRQRIYRLSQIEEGYFKSRVYALPNPEAYIHAWNNPEVFDDLIKDSLTLREGCAVFLRKGQDGCYSGSTREKTCGSTLRGASYASSSVTVCNDEIVSWDQGWNDEGEQVWGAIKSGYIFKRK